MYVAVELSKAVRGGCTRTYIHTACLRTHVDHNVRTYVATSTKLVCHIRTQQTRSTEKDKDVNWVRTNVQTAKNHSTEEGDTLHGVVL